MRVVKNAMLWVLLVPLLACLASGCNSSSLSTATVGVDMEATADVENTPAPSSNTATVGVDVEATTSVENTPTRSSSAATWELVRQVEVEHRMTVAGFHDELFGITVGYSGMVYYTTDGGETWTKANNSSMCRYGLDIVDENVAWNIGNGGQVRVSTDGGRNWEAVSNLSDLGISQWISFLDTQIGWAASTQQLWATSDGGQTWTDVTLPDNLLVAAIALQTATDGYVLGYTGSLYITHDGGETWTSQALGLGEDRLDFSAQPAMRFFDAQNGVIVAKLASQGIVALRTTDGGETWSRESVMDGTELNRPRLYLSCDGKFLTVTVPDVKFITLRYNP